MAGMSAEQYAGLRLRALRLARGMSQELLAAEMTSRGHGWHQTMAAKTEAAQRPLRLNELVDLACIFSVSPAEFLPGQMLLEASWPAS